MKQFKLAFLIILLLCGCSKHVINYEIGRRSHPFRGALSNRAEKSASIVVDTFEDQRPQEERKGHSGKFLAFASKDDDFKDSPNISITDLLKKELQEAGLKIIDENSTVDYHITGEVIHFQTMVKHPGTMVIPYLGTVATLWESDEYTTIVTIKARIKRTAGGEILFDREFNISEEVRLKTGILNLERWFGRGIDYQFKRLNIALADVLGQIRDEVIKFM
ncbi:MAG: hypothetical protein ISS46_02225 [Candidatus Omnitrophica bacterium]|nr:hypothetical protein [Candidatus Omnitrophota bacterium]